MSAYEVPQPIICSPFEEPAVHWHIVEGEMPERRPGRRPAVYYYLDPADEPSEEQRARGFKAFRRYAEKMATGSGKTTVMALLDAWSILNKVNSPSDGRFSDVVLVVCPNVTIRGRLRELDPEEGESSVY